MSRFNQYLEAAKYLIGYKVAATKSGVSRYVGHDGGLTGNKKEAFVFNVKDMGIKEVMHDFEKKYKDLGYDLHYYKIYERREDNE